MEFKILAVGPEKEVWERFPYAAWDQGFELAWVRSSEEALEILSRVPMDVLVVDLDFLDLSGPEVIRAAKNKNAATKILAISAYTEKQKDAHSLLDGFQQKPLTEQSFSEWMGTLIARKQQEELCQSTLAWSDFEIGKPFALAKILLIEYDTGLAQPLIRFLQEPHRSNGIYNVQRTSTISDASPILEFFTPDLVLMNCPDIIKKDPPVAKELRALKVQPKDYIFYMGSFNFMDMKTPFNQPGWPWWGKLWTEESLSNLGRLVRAVAFHHDLIRFV